MIKLIGSLLIIIACTGAGFSFAERFSGRTKQIRQLQNALMYMETEIIYGSTPLIVIMQNLSDKTRGSLSSIFAEVVHQITTGQGNSFQDSWKNALNKYWHKTALKENEKQILTQLGDTLGLSDRMNQQKHLQLALVHLRTEEDIALEEQKKYEKLSRTLGFLAGTLVVILIY